MALVETKFTWRPHGAPAGASTVRALAYCMPCVESVSDSVGAVPLLPADARDARELNLVWF